MELETDNEDLGIVLEVMLLVRLEIGRFVSFGLINGILEVL